MKYFTRPTSDDASPVRQFAVCLKVLDEERGQVLILEGAEASTQEQRCRRAIDLHLHGFVDKVVIVI